MTHLATARFSLAVAVILALAMVSISLTTSPAAATPNRGIGDLLEEFPLDSGQPDPPPVDAAPVAPAPATPTPPPADEPPSDEGGSGLLLVLIGLGVAGGAALIVLAVARTRRRRVGTAMSSPSAGDAERTAPKPSPAPPVAKAPMPARAGPTSDPFAARVRQTTPAGQVAQTAAAAAARRAPTQGPAAPRPPKAAPSRPQVAQPVAAVPLVPTRGNPFDAHIRPGPAQPAPVAEVVPRPAAADAVRPAANDRPRPPDPPAPAPARRVADRVPATSANGAGAVPLGVVDENGSGAPDIMASGEPLAREGAIAVLARGATPYDVAVCARFAAGLNDEVLDRSILLFAALARHGRIGSFRLAERLGAGTGDLSGLLLTPLKRRADGLRLGAPFVTDHVPGSRARVWRDAAGLAGRMERALRAEELARAEEAVREPLERYRPLTAALRRLEGDEVSWSLPEIEAMIGAELPPAARTWRRWWANRADTDSHVQARAWLDAGLLAFPALRQDRVDFRRPAVGRQRARVR